MIPGRKFRITWAFLFCSLAVFAQPAANDQWWNPADNPFPVIEGQAWPKEVKEPYDRFPARAAQTLNPNVWNISHSSAGLYLKFRTNADDIIVRYVVTGGLAMSHMPATGVSGVDLYAIDPDGNWHWAPGRFSFGDTIQYHFSHIAISRDFPGRDYEFRLFLPLYNAVRWLEIGVEKGKHFIPMPLSADQPVVVYGTSIAQGACASRPGMAWPAILERALDRPLINLGFSGTGRLENSVLDLMTEIDAKLYVLDCLPNLTREDGFPDAELEKRIRNAVHRLQEKRPEIPILLVEHSGGLPGSEADTARVNNFENANKVLRRVFARLQAAGVQHIYLLGNREIGLDMNATVAGVHPNDLGMMKYATAYEKKIREILQEPVGSLSTTLPVVQSRDGYYDWRARHAEILQMNKTDPPDNVILGNSIIHYWGGLPKAPLARGADSWDQYFKPLDVRNLGFGWDRTENVLWRIQHGELDGYRAKHVVLMIGTNNLGACSDEAILAGIRAILLAIRDHQPATHILLSGIFPRRGMEKRIRLLNKQIARLTVTGKITYIDPGTVLLNKKGTIDESLFVDGLHPDAAGYQKIARVVEPFLKRE